MEANDNEGAFLVDADIHQRARSRSNGDSSSRLHPRSNHPGIGSSPTEALDEGAPLLADSAGNSRRNSADSDGLDPPEWFGTAELRHLPWWKRPSIYWLLPPFLLFTLAFGGIVVPKLNLIMNLICDDFYASRAPGNDDPISGPMDPGNHFDRCRNPDVASRASLFLLYASLISGLLSAITSPKLGALSDRYGRTKLLALTTSGVLLGEVLTILAAKYPQSVDVNWILVGYAFDGICGSFIVGMALAHSYATDCTPPQRRNVAFGYFHACLFTGIALGPILAGYIIKKREPIVGKNEAVLLIFYIALGLHVLFIAFLALVIPESLSKTRQYDAREKYHQKRQRLAPTADYINQFRSINLVKPLKILYPTGPGSSPALRRNLILLAATDTIMFSIAMGSMGVITIYVRNRFGWQEWETSEYVSVVNSCRVLVLLIVLPTITRLIRGKNGTAKQPHSGSDRFDLTIIRVAIFFDMLGYLGFSLVRNGSLFMLSGAIASFGGMGSPTLGAALTKHVPPDRVGQLLGATGLMHAFARVIGPTVFNGIYSATTKSFEQTVFVCLAATFGAAFACSWFVRPHVYLQDLGPDGSPSPSPAPSIAPRFEREEAEP